MYTVWEKTLHVYAVKHTVLQPNEKVGSRQTHSNSDGLICNQGHNTTKFQLTSKIAFNTQRNTEKETRHFT